MTITYDKGQGGKRYSYNGCQWIDNVEVTQGEHPIVVIHFSDKDGNQTKKRITPIQLLEAIRLFQIGSIQVK